MIHRLALLPALLALAGCAATPQTEADGTPAPFGLQSVRVQTPGVSGSTCMVQTRSGTKVVTAPARLDVPRDPSPLVVTCSKGEHFRGALSLPARKAPGADGEAVYTYPDNVSVTLALDEPSLHPRVRIF
jgi:hypothetical protein